MERRQTSGRIAHVVLAVCALLFVVALNLTPIYTNDFWIQLELGRMIRSSGEIPRTILFCFSEARDQPFYAHEWLPSLVSSALYSAVGYRGMIVFKCLLALLIAGLAYRLAIQISRKVSISILVASLTMLAINFRTHMRPELFAFVFALIALNLLHAFLRSGRLRWLVGLLPVALVWANSHGSFLLNLALPPLFLLGTLIDDGRGGRWRDGESLRRRTRRIYLPLAAFSLALVLVSLVNPYGWELFVHTFRYARAAYTREHLVEFGATFDPRIRAMFYFKVYLFYLATILLSFLPGRKNWTGVSVLLFLVFGYLSTDAIRFTAWFAIAGSYVLATNLAGLAAGSTARRALAVGLSIALAAATLTVIEKGNVRGKPIGFRNMAPLSEGAIEFIRTSGIEGNVFNAFNYADQLIYHFYPRIRVAIDSRVDAYGERYYLRYRSLSGRSFKLLAPPEELIEFLDRYDVRTIVTRPYDYNNWVKKGHVERLAATGWRMVYNDPSTAILVRDGGSSVVSPEGSAVDLEEPRTQPRSDPSEGD